MATLAKLLLICIYISRKKKGMKKLFLGSSDLLAAAAADGYDFVDLDELHCSGT